jgi:prefoldin alpha subunit
MTQLSYQQVQSLIRETDQLKEQYQFLLQQSDLITHSINDLEGSKSALKEIISRNVGEKILIPIGTQILLPVVIESKESVLHDLGSNVLKKLTLEESIKKIESRIEIFKKSSTSIFTQIVQFEDMIAKRENLLNQLIPLSENRK